MMKKRIDPDKLLSIMKKIHDNAEGAAKNEKGVHGKYFFSAIESCVYSIMTAIEGSIVCEEPIEQKAPEQPCSAKSYPHAINDEHRRLLERLDECRNTIKVGVYTAFNTRDEWRELYETGKYIGCVPPKDEIPMLKDYIVKRIIESKEIDEKIAEIEKGAVK